MRFLIAVLLILLVMGGMALLVAFGPVGIGIAAFGVPLISSICDKFMDD